MRQQAPLAETRFVRGAGSADLSFQAYDSNGEPAAPNGTVTVTVTSSNGTALVTDGATTGSGTNPRVHSLAATSLAVVDRLTVDWTDNAVVVRTEYVDVVGGTIGAEAEMEAIEATLTALTSAQFLQARGAAENRFVQVTNRLPWHRLEVQRFNRAVRSEYGCDTGLPGAYWPDLVEVRWARIYDSPTSYTALDASELASIVAPDVESRMVRLDVEWLVAPYGVEVGYVAGLNTIPGDLKRAFAQAIRREATMFNTPVPDGSPTFATFEGTVFGLARPGPDKAYGLDDIDAVYQSYCDPRAGLG